MSTKNVVNSEPIWDLNRNSMKQPPWLRWQKSVRLIEKDLLLIGSLLPFGHEVSHLAGELQQLFLADPHAQGAEHTDDGAHLWRFHRIWAPKFQLAAVMNLTSGKTSEWKYKNFKIMLMTSFEKLKAFRLKFSGRTEMHKALPPMNIEALSVFGLHGSMETT